MNPMMGGAPGVQVQYVPYMAPAPMQQPPKVKPTPSPEDLQFRKLVKQTATKVLGGAALMGGSAAATMWGLDQKDKITKTLDQKVKKVQEKAAEKLGEAAKELKTQAVGKVQEKAAEKL